MSIIFKFGLFLLPFIFWPWAKIPFEIPRVWFFDRWVECLALVGFLNLLFRFRERKIRISIVVAVILFLFAAIGGSLLGPDWTKSVWGNYWRDDGLVTLFHLIGFYLFVVLMWQDKWQLSTVKIIVISSFIVSLWSVVDGTRFYLFNDSSVRNWQGAFGSTFGQPKFLTGYLLLIFLFIGYWYKKTKNIYEKYLLILITVVNCVALLLTKSYAGIAGLFFLISYFLFTRSKTVVYKYLIILMALIIFVAVMFGYVIKLGRMGFVAESRERIFHKLILSVMKRPLLGWGWANVDYAFEASVWPIRLEKDVNLDKAHSTIFEVLVTTGIVGLTAYLSLLCLIGKSLWEKRKDPWYQMLLLVFILFILHSQSNVISIGEEMFFWLIAGLATVKD